MATLLFLSMSYIFMDTFFEFGVVKNFVYHARITVVLTSDLFGCDYDCALDDDLLLLLPVLSVIVKMYKYRCLHSCYIFSL